MKGNIEKKDTMGYYFFSVILILASVATYASYLSGDMYLLMLCGALAIGAVVCLIIEIRY